MRTRAVIAHYWIDYREQSESFDSIPAAFEFLRWQARDRAVMIDKIALDCGTVVLSRGQIERLIRIDRRLPARPAPAAPRPKTAMLPMARLAGLILSWALSR
jgi:hypothetical protein